MWHFCVFNVLSYCDSGLLLQHLEFTKQKKRVAAELHDKEKLSDSCLVIGESYQKLRNFSKALKWYNKSWEMYKAIGNMEVGYKW